MGERADADADEAPLGGEFRAPAEPAPAVCRCSNTASAARRASTSIAVNGGSGGAVETSSPVAAMARVPARRSRARSSTSALIFAACAADASNAPHTAPNASASNLAPWRKYNSAAA